MANWSAEQIPDLSGKTIIVTGGNSGIGFEAALQLAGKGAGVILACRNLDKASTALESIRSSFPSSSVEPFELDLAKLDSVRAFAKRFLDSGRSLDVLCNNAGVMALPLRRTAEGFEMQLGTNHLGHFALTGLLLERLLATEGARIVSVASNFHRFGRIDFDDLNWQHSYGRWPAYGRSKLANLLFTYELQRRLDRLSTSALAVACHPGYAATNLPLAGFKKKRASLQEGAAKLGNRILAQSAAKGALPTLRAAVDPEVRGGDYFGPDGLAEMWGSPIKVESNARSHDLETAARLWEISEELTGVRYDAIRLS
ncbi:MAG: oxidoreductase [Myxococcota bacterium]